MKLFFAYQYTYKEITIAEIQAFMNVATNFFLCWTQNKGCHAYRLGRMKFQTGMGASKIKD